MFKINDAVRRRMLEDALVEYLLDPQTAPAVTWTGALPSFARPVREQAANDEGAGRAA